MTLLADQRTADGGNWASTSRLLRDGLKSLDPTAAECDLAIRRYKALGEELDEVWFATRGENRIFPQGSFRLGTVTRRVNGEIDIDIDCVAVRDIDRLSITQAELKQEVGRAVKAYARRADSGSPIVTESDRCWTLSWPGMHLDVLPAIPASAFLEGLLITDKSVRAWQHSNPEGYANWFHARMAVEFREEEVRLAKALQVDDVPAWQVKTSLQRSVQALKRHRDLYFISRPERRPSSIVITTLAAKAYSGGGNLLDVLRDITRLMPSFIEYDDGRWSLPNPVEPDENFTDYWATDPDLPKYFFEWMTVAQRDFAGLDGVAGLDVMARHLEKAFGTSVSKAAMTSAASTLGAARSARSVSIATGTGALTLASTAAFPEPAHAAKPNSFYGGPAH
jgi:hypothetical protein